MGLFTNPLGYAGYPPGASAPATVVNSTVRAATAAEAAAGTLTDVYISPATAQSSTALDFASPPVLGFGSTTPRPVHATTLDSTGLTSLATGAGAVINIGTATGTIGFFGITAAARPGATTDIKDGLALMGLITNGGATPLNLDGGALGSGTHTLTDGSNIIVGSTTGTKIGTATTQKLGFYNATPVVQQTQGAITNSVTVGGSTGVIADFADLTTYSNSAAAIRNDIYQLALGLSGCIAALRTYGLLG